MELLVMVLSETTIPAEFLPPKVPSGVRSGTFAGHPAMPRKDDASACSAKPLGPEPLVSKGLQLQLHFWDRNRFYRAGSLFQIGMEPVRIDIMTSVTGLDFVAAWERKVIVDFGGEQVPVLCREDVLQSKIAAGRIRDRQDVQRLARPQS